MFFFVVLVGPLGKYVSVNWAGADPNDDYDCHDCALCAIALWEQR